jgi:hypothetical protein
LATASSSSRSVKRVAIIPMSIRRHGSISGAATNWSKLKIVELALFHQLSESRVDNNTIASG